MFWPLSSLYDVVKSFLTPNSINSTDDLIFDSVNVTTSPVTKDESLRYTISMLFGSAEPFISAFVEITLAIASESDPVIISPTTQLLETATDALNFNLSNVGAFSSTDSYTAINLATSGRF